MSNSPIIDILTYGITGNRGPTGLTGSIGPTGTPGTTGFTGNIAVYFVSATAAGGVIQLTLSDGTTFSVSGNFRGSTTADKTFGLVKGSNTGSSEDTQRYGIFHQVIGGTFIIKGLTATGSLYASLTGPNNEYISIDSIYFGTNIIGNYDATTMGVGKILYLGNPYTVFGGGLTYSPLTSENISKGHSGAFNFTNTVYDGAGKDDTSYHLNSGSKILTLNPIPPGSIHGITGLPYTISPPATLGVYLDLNAAGTFVLNTPIGIRGFTGYDNFGDNQILSATLVINGDDVWVFPINIYFEQGENYLSCGKNIIGLTSFNRGYSWYATVAHRGHGIQDAEQCIPGYLFGSCCYETPGGTLGCQEYVTKRQCDFLYGTFNPMSSCSENCAENGVCCVNGSCVESISPRLCESFGGIFWKGISCGSFNPDGLNYPSGDLTEDQLRLQGRFCYDPCDTPTVCCKGGKCLGNYTRAQCEIVLGGKAMTAIPDENDIGHPPNRDSCDLVNCCDLTVNSGPCCICDEFGGYECRDDVSVSECRALNGSFMGPNLRCTDVSCACVCSIGVSGGSGGGGPTGSCCGGGGGGGGTDEDGFCCQNVNDVSTQGPEFACVPSTQSQCSGPYKKWSPTRDLCLAGCTCNLNSDGTIPAENRCCCSNVRRIVNNNGEECEEITPCYSYCTPSGIACNRDFVPDDVPCSFGGLYICGTYDGDNCPTATDNCGGGPISGGGGGLGLLPPGGGGGLSGPTGYCCIRGDLAPPNSPGNCTNHLTEHECVNYPLGHGTWLGTNPNACEDNNCEGTTPPGGQSGGCVDNVTRGQCTGQFVPYVSCASNPCIGGSGGSGGTGFGGGGGGGGNCFNGAEGICCKNNNCLPNVTTKTECCAGGGVWYDKPNALFGCTGNSCQEVPYFFRPCNRPKGIPCNTGEFTSDCLLCNSTIKTKPVLRIMGYTAGADLTTEGYIPDNQAQRVIHGSNDPRLGIAPCPLVIHIERVPFNKNVECIDNPESPGFNGCCDLMFNTLGINIPWETSLTPSLSPFNNNYCNAQNILFNIFGTTGEVNEMSNATLAVQLIANKVLDFWGNAGVALYPDSNVSFSNPNNACKCRRCPSPNTPCSTAAPFWVNPLKFGTDIPFTWERYCGGEERPGGGQILLKRRGGWICDYYDCTSPCSCVDDGGPVLGEGNSGDNGEVTGEDFCNNTTEQCTQWAEEDNIYQYWCPIPSDSCFLGASNATEQQWYSNGSSQRYDPTFSSYTNQCSSFSGFSSLKNVKVYLNNTDYICVMTSCGDCVDYELCEET